MLSSKPLKDPVDEYSNDVYFKGKNKDLLISALGGEIDQWVPRSFEHLMVFLRHYKEIQPVHSKGDQPWGFFGSNDAKAETPILWPPHAKKRTHWKRLWCWEGLGAGEEGDDRGWDGWMASLTRWTRVWVNSESWWWTGRPGMLRFMGSQRVGHDWATELNWTEYMLGINGRIFKVR